MKKGGLYIKRHLCKSKETYQLDLPTEKSQRTPIEMACMQINKRPTYSKRYQKIRKETNTHRKRGSDSKRDPLTQKTQTCGETISFESLGQTCGETKCSSRSHLVSRNTWSLTNHLVSRTTWYLFRETKRPS